MARVQRRGRLPGRPVRTDHFHITLAFLGQVESRRSNELLKLAGQLDFPVCELVLDTLGQFRRAGVAWLGCSDVPEALQGFQAGLGESVRAHGFTLDQRPWTPHLTLYRDLRKGFATIDFEGIRWRPKRYCLMRSKQGRDGVYYQSLGEWPQ
jgi:2'-5' RNA ligase